MVKINKNFIRQVLLYGVIGSCSAMLDFVLFSLLFGVMGINEYLANIISVHVGITVSFILNRKYNFKKTDRVLFRACSFYLTGLFGLLLSEGFLFIGIIRGLPIMWVKLVSIFIVAAIQFTLNKFIAFKQT